MSQKGFVWFCQLKTNSTTLSLLNSTLQASEVCDLILH